MKHIEIAFSIVLMAVLALGCTKEDVVAVGEQSNFFTGVYNPENRLKTISCSEHVVGVECGDYELLDCMQMSWCWSPEHLDSILFHDDRIDAVGVMAIRYYYDSMGRLSRVTAPTANHQCLLTYDGNHLASIVETRGGWTRTYRFSYSRSDYPESFEYHIQGQYVNLTDTYTLRWRNGNLVSAVCGSGNDRYNIDSITYNYDNTLNPFCGLLLPKFFENYGIVDAPLFFSKNIPTGITYYTTSGSVQDIYYTLDFSFTDNRPSQIVHQYENFYWCSYTDTYTLHY